MRSDQVVKLLTAVIVPALLLFVVFPEYKLYIYLPALFLINYVIIYFASKAVGIEYRHERPDPKDKRAFTMSEYKDKQALYEEYGKELGKDVYEYVYEPEKYEKRVARDVKQAEREAYAKRLAANEKMNWARQMSAQGKKIKFNKNGQPKVPKNVADAIKGEARKAASRKFPLNKSAKQMTPLMPGEIKPWMRVLRATISVMAVMFVLSLIVMPWEIFTLLLIFFDFMVFYLNFNPKYPSPVKKRMENRIAKAETGTKKLALWVASWRYSSLWKPFMMSCMHIMGLWLSVFLTRVAGYDVGQLWAIIGL